MDVTAVNDGLVSGRLFREPGRATKLDEKGDHDLICGRTILEDVEEVGFERDCGHGAHLLGLASWDHRGRARQLLRSARDKYSIAYNLPSEL